MFEMAGHCKPSFMTKHIEVEEREPEDDEASPEKPELELPAPEMSPDVPSPVHEEEMSVPTLAVSPPKEDPPIMENSFNPS